MWVRVVLLEKKGSGGEVGDAVRSWGWTADVPAPLKTFASGFPLVFFFQADDGIRDLYVTGVQTCALPIYARRGAQPRRRGGLHGVAASGNHGSRAGRFRGHARGRRARGKIGRASCRERV